MIQRLRHRTTSKPSAGRAAAESPPGRARAARLSLRWLRGATPGREDDARPGAPKAELGVGESFSCAEGSPESDSSRVVVSHANSSHESDRRTRPKADAEDPVEKDIHAGARGLLDGHYIAWLQGQSQTIRELRLMVGVGLEQLERDADDLALRRQPVNADIPGIGHQIQPPRKRDGLDQVILSVRRIGHVARAGDQAHDRDHLVARRFHHHRVPFLQVHVRKWNIQPPDGQNQRLRRTPAGHRASLGLEASHAEVCPHICLPFPAVRGGGRLSPQTRRVTSGLGVPNVEFRVGGPVPCESWSRCLRFSRPFPNATDGPWKRLRLGSGPHRLFFAGGSPSQSRWIAIGVPLPNAGWCVGNREPILGRRPWHITPCRAHRARHFHRRFGLPHTTRRVGGPFRRHGPAWHRMSFGEFVEGDREGIGPQGPPAGGRF